MEDQLRRAVRQIIIEALTQTSVQTPSVQLSPEYTADLDAVLTGLQAMLRSLEAAHQKAPDPISKTIITGVHSDLFNAAAEARGFIKKLKTGRPQG